MTASTLKWALGGAACMVSAVCAAAGPLERPACNAIERPDKSIPREYVETQQQLVDTLKRQRDSAKTKFDAATATRDATVQRLAEARANGEDAGDTGVGAAEVAVAAASKTLADAVLAWHDIDARASCAEKELNEATTAYSRSRLYKAAVEPVVSVAGGAGGTNRFGGGLLVSMMDSVVFSEVQLGATLSSFTPQMAPSGAKIVAKNSRDSASAFQVPIRTYFGNSDFGLFLGVSSTLLFFSSGLVVAAAPQAGVRLRGISYGDPIFFFDVKLFAEPWFFFDGSSTAVLFGAEIGVGAGPKVDKVESIKWTYDAPPQPAAH